MTFETIHNMDHIMDTFLIPDSDIIESKVNIKKLLTITFEGPNSMDQLSEYHRSFTETTPYQYFGLAFSIAKNYQTQKKYTLQGETDLTEPKMKLLKYFLPDGSFIFIRSDMETMTLYLLISLNGDTVQELEDKSSEMEQTLLDFIKTFPE